MAESEEFIVVRGRRGKKGIKFRSKSKVAHAQESIGEESDVNFNLDSFTKRLDSCKQEIFMSDFFSRTYEQILSCLNEMYDRFDKHSTSEKDDSASAHRNNNRSQGNTCVKAEDERKLHILSYGIGNFTSCLIARYQLAFLLALRDKLESQCSACELFDPVFTIHERDVLAAYKCEVSPRNEEGKRSCHVPTIAFMPHCGKALYNNFLWKNAASPGSALLFNFLLIGNSFDNMLQRTPTRQLEKTANYVLKQYIREIQLDNSFTHKDIFNDLALHWFPLSQHSSILSKLDQDCEEPVYEESEVELIRS
ncbi:hypothetical protein RRG08_054234 [Elysia crispata]|uniref:SRR1-like domain-containing protein n=1 Tax=Elysia crispata TaxID=231223 RepID=A0AAE0YBS0_9GAST|nr:hypothetical protein RRG08_054234 [Elysia crispata]